jgi:hypothetical protein
MKSVTKQVADGALIEEGKGLAGASRRGLLIYAVAIGAMICCGQKKTACNKEYRHSRAQNYLE